MDTSDKGEDAVYLSVIQNKAYVWNSTDACRLREEFRIAGALVGCLPRLPRQNIHLGLPLLLMPEEAKLLLEKGLARLLNELTSPEVPSKEDVNDFKKKRKELHKEQVKIARKNVKKDMTSRLAQILEGKKAKRNKILQQRREAGEHVSDSEFEKEVDFDPEQIEIPDLPEKHAMVQIHTARLKPRHPEFNTKWTYPESALEKLKYKVFKEFWEKGYYLTSAGKFGGDFLVYPGDPGRFHSKYIVLCLPQAEKLSEVELAALGRLGTNVKKTVLLCSVDNETDELVMSALEWSEETE